MTLAQPDDTAERMRLRDLVADRAEALGHPLAALMGHEWRIQADYLSARFDVVAAAVAAIERLARRSAWPLAQWHLHRLYAARTLSSRQIAARLVLSERTVESHVRSILAKTQCANRIGFVARWNQ